MKLGLLMASENVNTYTRFMFYENRYPGVHFSYIRNLSFIKWENFEIGVQELFWPTIVEILSHVKTDCNNKEVIVPLA